jgi:hypothetical protein
MRRFETNALIGTKKKWIIHREAWIWLNNQAFAKAQ